MNNTIIFTVIISFLISLSIGTFLIPFLRNLKFGQHIREEEPEHHQKKSGTPTMGGLIFISSTLILMLMLNKNPNNEGMLALYGFIAFGIIGLIDDGMKLFRKKNLGLRAYQKMLLIIIAAAALSFYILSNLNMSTALIIPFLHKTIDLGKWYVPFIVFYFACVTNGANFTDGLDGLASSVGLLILTFFALLSFALGHYSLSLFCTALIGALLGFLKFNMFPAKVFMGDTGSLAIGGAVATTAMLLQLPLLILLVGIIYVIELLSVLLQIIYFKSTGKRLFKMSPIHYHFELKGWDETKVMSSFSLVTVICCFIAFFSL